MTNLDLTQKVDKRLLWLLDCLKDADGDGAVEALVALLELAEGDMDKWEDAWPFVQINGSTV